MIPALNVYDSSFGEDDVLVGTCRFGLPEETVAARFDANSGYRQRIDGMRTI